MAGLLFLEDNQKRTGLMKRQIICLFACVILIGCSNTPEDDTALRIQMEVLYGENKELQEVPEGQPVAIVENGVFVGQCNDGVLSFKGIPYAKPPVVNCVGMRPSVSTRPMSFVKPVILASRVFRRYLRVCELLITSKVRTVSRSMCGRPAIPPGIVL